MPEDRAVPSIDPFLVFPITDDEVEIDDIDWDHIYLGDSPTDPETIALLGRDKSTCGDIDLVEIVYGEGWSRMIRVMDLVEAIMNGTTPCSCPKCTELMAEARELAAEDSPRAEA